MHQFIIFCEIANHACHVIGVGNTSHYGNLPVRSFLYSPEHQNDSMMLAGLGGGNNGGGPEYGDSSMGRPSPQLQSSHLHNHHQSSSSPSHGGMRMEPGMPPGMPSNGGVDGLLPVPISNNSSAYLPMNPNNKHFHHQISSNSLLHDEQETSSPSNSNQHLIPISAGTSSPGCLQEHIFVEKFLKLFLVVWDQLGFVILSCLCFS